MLNVNLTKELTLSEAVNIDDIQKDKMNIISAPVSSGKTYAAIHKFSSLLVDGQKMLYLIDTTAGKENISYSYNLIREFGDKEIQAYDKEVVEEYEKKERDVSKLIKPFAEIMTYAKLGSLVKRGLINLDDFGVIICDEMQSLIHYKQWEWGKLRKSFPFAATVDMDEFLSKSSLPYIAFNAVCERATGYIRIAGEFDEDLNYIESRDLVYTYVIVLSATPAVIRDAVKDFHEVRVDKDIRTLREKRRGAYTSIEDIPYILSETGRTLIYIPWVKTMNKVKENIEQKTGKKCVCLWSLNQKEKMTDEQKNVREILLSKGYVPEDIDVLIINDAYQTCMNLEPSGVKPTFDVVITHTSDPDIYEQARGRVRHDIDSLYVLGMENKNSIIRKPVPVEFLNRPLTKEDKDALSKYFNIKDSKGQLKKWPYISQHLNKRLYSVETKNRQSVIMGK